MEKDEAYKILGISSDATMAVISKFYLQKSEYYAKQLDDLKDLPHLSAEQTRLSSKLNLLKEAFISLGGHTDKPIIQATKKKYKIGHEALKKISEHLKKINNRVYQIVLIIILVFIAVFGIRYLSIENNKKKDSLNTAKQIELETQIRNLQEQKKGFQLRYENAERKINEIAKEVPFIITSITFRNIDSVSNNLENSNKKIFTKDKVRYIAPVLTILQIANNWNDKIKIKYIEPNGNINRNEKISPPGFSFEHILTLNPSSDEIIQLSGWGNGEESTYSAGQYKVEIWWNNKMLGKETFKIEE